MFGIKRRDVIIEELKTIVATRDVAIANLRVHARELEIASATQARRIQAYDAAALATLQAVAGMEMLAKHTPLVPDEHLRTAVARLREVYEAAIAKSGSYTVKAGDVVLSRSDIEMTASGSGMTASGSGLTDQP